MPVFVRHAVVCALALACAPITARAQSTRQEDLVGRIEMLERRVAELERRSDGRSPRREENAEVAQPIAATSGWRDLRNWRRLKTGMSEDEVRAILGEPAKVRGGVVAFWYWDKGEVTFVGGEVTQWREP